MEDITMNKIEINRKMGVVISASTDGQMFILNGQDIPSILSEHPIISLGIITGQVVYINDNSAIYVQDLDKKQNSNLFVEGLKLIDSKVSPKRKEYLVELLNTVLPKEDMDVTETIIKSRPLVSIIAFVCDIALHKNKKLAHPEAYHKDFSKYVANLFYEYGLDDTYDAYHTIGVKGVSVIPHNLIKPVSKSEK
jgi:hypothetical protein